MTVQTKQFIELDDILAIRFDCRSCGATVSLKLSDPKLMAGENSPHALLDACPICKIRWNKDLHGNTSTDHLIRKIAVTINQLKVAMQGDSKISEAKFALFVEIKMPKASSEALA